MQPIFQHQIKIVYGMTNPELFVAVKAVTFIFANSKIPMAAPFRLCIGRTVRKHQQIASRPARPRLLVYVDTRLFFPLRSIVSKIKFLFLFAFLLPTLCLGAPGEKSCMGALLGVTPEAL